ncbi:MAG: dipicolinate synthase subunit B [Ruminococcus flavefaciens]|nr:dipicolinate synthase subunit B [Ruminococcus flavefaciens]MCM1061118.1 dipicolinate synthase subunit B [Eubacterium sp.]
MADTLKGLKIGYALTGSFCTFERSMKQASILAEMGAELIPIMSETASTLSTRFGTPEENLHKLQDICHREIITDISMAEPIGPNNMTDLMIVAPCTSNTAAKLANGITDSAVTMAVKSHLRSGKPVLLAIASNDSLLGSAKNLGELFNRKNYFFVPMLQDDYIKKPASLVAEFEMIPEAALAAMNGIQLRPIIYHK